jgi:endonuclease/exonuclease/phosphatase family metal-dependent hydrolase
MRSSRLFLAGLPLVLAASFAMSDAAAPAAMTPLRLATWNLEWLVDGSTARAARIACRDAGISALPCDVVRELSRNSADLAHLADYAKQLDADVIAFQEVQNEAIARRVFRGYRICMNKGPELQHVGFALRPGLARDCGHPLTTLARNGQGRAGLQLTITARGIGDIELLAVHLKSGCARDPLESASEACQLLAAQARALGQWIATRSAQQARFVVLGDFNRGGPPNEADPFWAFLDPRAFQASSSRLPFRNCVWGAPYREFIDHILISQALSAALPAKAFEQFGYHPRDATRYQLSDHCPVRVSLNAQSVL